MSNDNMTVMNVTGGVPGASIASLQTVGARLAAVSQPAPPLAEMVRAMLAKLVEDGQSFTAYDVTMILRALIPPSQCLLPHYDRPGAPGVQSEVHRQMAGYVISGIYTQRTAYPNGVDPARLYVPVTRNGRTAPSTPISTYLTDDEWDAVQPLLPPRPRVGRPNADHRTIIGGILWVQRTGASWRRLPGEFGKWNTVYCRYRRWQRAGVWQPIAAVLAA